MFYAVLIISASLFIIGSINEGEEIATAYIKSCLGLYDKEFNIWDCEKEHEHSYITKEEYRVDFKNQLVIEKGFISKKLKNCVVFNKEEWSCALSDNENDKGYITMHDNTLSASYFDRTINNKNYLKYQDTSRVHYWIQNIKNFIPS